MAVPRTKTIVLIASALTLASCGERDERSNAVAAATPAAAAMPAPAAGATAVRATAAMSVPPPSDRPLSCQAEIGAAAAARRVALCRNVSPATRPPCNAANSCAMIEDEIARSCALFDDKDAVANGCVDPKSMAAAAAVVRLYYSAINARDYDTAWSQWGDDGRPGQTRAAFAAGFAHTRSVRVTIGRLTLGDGGAGSIYQPVPVTVDAMLDNGTHQRFGGSYVVRRVNGVDGATPHQLRWHLDSAQLKPLAGR